MKAIVQRAYGSSDVLRLHDIDKPQLKADGVLARVHAASINHGDWLVTTGVPYLISTVKTHIVAIVSATRDGWLNRPGFGRGS